MNQRLHGSVAYCDGWAHDYPWLARLYDAAELTPSFRLEHLLSLLDEDQARRFDALKRQVIAESGLQRHRASTDARMLQLALRRLRPASLRRR